MSFSIAGKVALVTGANRGIGKAIVDSLLEHGASKVYLAVRNPESTRELEQSYGDRVVTVKADVSDDASINALAETAHDVELVVNNAGVLTTHNPLDENAATGLQHEFDVNVFGLLRVANAFADVLVRKQGALVQLNSVASLRNFSGISTYSASKAASYTLTQGLRDELGAKGVTVLSVHPGPIDTDMARSAGVEGGSQTSTVSEGIVAALEASKPHLFPDEMAQEFEKAYRGFAENIVLAELS